MLYRQSPKPGKSNGKLDWVEEGDPRWSKTILPWDEWAPQNVHTENVFTIQRNGYGYGFHGVPNKLATTTLAICIVPMSTHLVFIMVNGRLYEGHWQLGHVLVFAWNSAPAKELGASAEMNEYRTWSQIAKIGEEESGPQLILDKTGTGA